MLQHLLNISKSFSWILFFGLICVVLLQYFSLSLFLGKTLGKVLGIHKNIKIMHNDEILSLTTQPLTRKDICKDEVIFIMLRETRKSGK